MNLNDPDSGVYALARLAIISSAALLSLWICASHFDETELKSLGTIIVAVAGSEIWRKSQINGKKNE
jgi:hypothetical protein